MTTYSDIILTWANRMKWDDKLIEDACDDYWEICEQLEAEDLGWA